MWQVPIQGIVAGVVVVGVAGVATRRGEKQEEAV